MAQRGELWLPLCVIGYGAVFTFFLVCNVGIIREGRSTNFIILECELYGFILFGVYACAIKTHKRMCYNAEKQYWASIMTTVFIVGAFSIMLYDQLYIHHNWMCLAYTALGLMATFTIFTPLAIIGIAVYYAFDRLSCAIIWSCFMADVGIVGLNIYWSITNELTPRIWFELFGFALFLLWILVGHIIEKSNKSVERRHYDAIYEAKAKNRPLLTGTTIATFSNLNGGPVTFSPEVMATTTHESRDAFVRNFFGDKFQNSTNSTMPLSTDTEKNELPTATTANEGADERADMANWSFRIPINVDANLNIV